MAALPELEMGIGCNKWFAKSDQLRDTYLAALDAGVSLFNTAQVYKGSEACLGDIRRETGRDAFIVSKFDSLHGNVRQLVPSLMDTNRRLRSDHVDGFLVHFPRGDIDALAEGLDLAHHNGIATHVGCSNFGILELRRLHAALAKRGVALAFNEIEFSLLRSAPAETDGLLDVCRELDVKVLSWAPLGSGRLAGRHADDVADPATRRLIGALDRVAAARGKTRAAVAINWCICKGTVPIPGARTPEQARENCAGAGWRLSAEEVAGLDAHALRDGGFYSDPEAILCFAGIRLPRVLRGFAHAVVRFVLPLVTYFLPLQRG